MGKGTHHIACGLATALSLAHVGCASASGTAPEPSQPSGAAQTEAIDRGFVLLDGRYLPPPYVVSRQGLGLFINGHKIETETTRSAGSARELVMQRLEQVRATYERHLREADCYVVFSDGGETWLDSYEAAYDLPRLLSLLRSDAPIEAKLAELRRRGWGFAFSDDALRKLATEAEARSELDERLEKLGKDLLRVEEFGRDLGEPLNSGFVFLDGAYLDSPYTVTREGLAVFLNGHMRGWPERWPPRARPPGNADPEMPAGISRETSLYDDILKDYLARKVRYASTHDGREEEAAFMADTIRALPCISTARLEEPNRTSLHVTTFRGEECTFGLVSPRREGQPTDKESVLKRAVLAQNRLSTRLAQGDCLFLRSGGGALSMSGGMAGGKLPGIVAVLRSSEPVERKVEKLRQTFLRGQSEDTIRDIVVGFRASPQLEERLRALRPGATPEAATSEEGAG